MEGKLVAAQTELEQTITKMINNKVVLYKDEDSIATMDNDISLQSNLQFKPSTKYHHTKRS